MILSPKAKLLTAVMLVSIAPTNAQPYGRSDGAPRDMVESSPQTGGYCDRSGCPNHSGNIAYFMAPSITMVDGSAGRSMSRTITAATCFGSQVGGIETNGTRPGLVGRAMLILVRRNHAITTEPMTLVGVTATAIMAGSREIGATRGKIGTPRPRTGGKATRTTGAMVQTAHQYAMMLTAKTDRMADRIEDSPKINIRVLGLMDRISGPSTVMVRAVVRVATEMTPTAKRMVGRRISPIEIRGLVKTSQAVVPPGKMLPKRNLRQLPSA